MSVKNSDAEISGGYIFDIKKFAVHDGPGIRTTVFLKGCMAHCWWCHNPESQQMHPEPFTRKHTLDDQIFEELEEAGRFVTVDSILSELRKERLYMDQSGGGVTFSGGEPFLQANFLHALIKKSRKEDIHIAVDTTGYVQPQILEKLLGDIDLFLYDVKIMDPKIHLKYTGVSNERILRNLEILIRNKKRIRIRFPVIPDITDTQNNLGQVLIYLKSIAEQIERLDLLPFHKIAREKYHRFGREFKLNLTTEPTEKRMAELYQQFQELGIPLSVGG